MNWLTAAFVIGVAIEVATRWWLAGRQIAAVRAHRDRVPDAFVAGIALADQQKSTDYAVARARFGRVAVGVEAAMRLILTVGGGIAAVQSAWDESDWPQPWIGVAVVLTVLALARLIDLPLSIWRTFRLEARFGFNRSSFALFAADVVKRSLLALLFGAPLVLALLLLMERAGRWWWLCAWLVWLAVTVTMTWVWPRFIAPIFNRFTPLADAVLAAHVEAVLKRCGFSSKGVFVMDGSRRSAHGNAYFSGIGRNKRIVLFDTLLARLAPAEVAAVLAHELGHFRLRHVRQHLLLSAAASLAGLGLLAWLAREPAFYSALGIPMPAPQAALLLFMMVVPVCTYFVQPIAAWWSRRHEIAADEFAARHADPGELASALVKLYRDNAATLTPDRIHSAFYDTHPPALERIARLNALAG